MQIYLARDNEQAGPYTLEELNIMLSTGEVLLTDLVWHYGMTQWRVLGEVTGGELVYRPQGGVDPAPPSPSDRPSDSRQSVAQVYGGAPKPASKPKPKPSADTVYASVGARFLAFCLNMAAFVLTTLPLQMAILDSGIDPNQLQARTFAEYRTLGETLSQQISPTAILTSFALMTLFVAAQLFLIATRGQSLGKLAVGIRVVDADTRRLPAFAKNIGLRTLVLFLIYQLASVINAVALILLIVHYVLAQKSPTKQGWHDKLANTVVVKARPEQLQNAKTTHVQR